MNGAAIIRAVRTATLVPVSQVSDQELLTWINEGYYRIASQSQWPWLEGQGEMETVAGQQAYSLSTAIVDDLDKDDGEEPPAPVPGTPLAVRRIVAVYDAENRVRLRQWSPASAVDVYGGDWPSSSKATAFFVWAGSLYLIPVPSVSGTRYLVLLHKAPTALTSGTGPEFDSMFHSALVHYGEFRMWQREEDLDKAQAAYAHYADTVERMRLWYTQRFDDQPWYVGEGVQGGAWTNTPFLDGL